MCISVRQRGVGLLRQEATKGKKDTSLWLPIWAVEMLEHRLVTGPAGPMGLVFPSIREGLREVSTVETQWRRFRERNPQWSWITPKVFRKTVARLKDCATIHVDQASRKLRAGAVEEVATVTLRRVDITRSDDETEGHGE